MGPSSPEPDVITLLAVALRRLRDELAAELRAAGFTDLRPAQGYVLSRLSFGGVTAGQLGEHLGLTRQAAGQLADELERLGYVRREPHPADRRGKVIVLTDRGRARVQAVEQALAGIEVRLAEGLGLQALKSLRAGLVALGAGRAPLRPDARPPR
jgi:DNA-binding MarR family transcriptional regulator